MIIHTHIDLLLLSLQQIYGFKVVVLVGGGLLRLVRDAAVLRILNWHVEEMVDVRSVDVVFVFVIPYLWSFVRFAPRGPFLSRTQNLVGLVLVPNALVVVSLRCRLHDCSSICLLVESLHPDVLV